MITYTKKDKDKIYELEQLVLNLQRMLQQVLNNQAASGSPVVQSIWLWNADQGKFQQLTLSGVSTAEVINITS